MQFGIRDLLGLTGIVTVYAAGLGLLASEGLLRRGSVIPILPFCVITALVIGRGIGPSNQAGRRLMAFRDGTANYWHVGCLGFFLLGVVFAIGGQVNFSPIFLLMPTMFHVIREAGGRVTFGENGVLANIMLSRWEDYSFTLDAAEGRLHAVPRTGARPGKWIAARSIRIPREHAQAVAEVLRAKQDAPS